jgi:hemolysin III
LSRGQPVKQFGLFIFGLTLLVCYGCSALYHAVRSPSLTWFVLADYIGIYLLIAGSMTPVALGILEGSWRWGVLLLAWGLALAGIHLKLFVARTPMTPLLTTGLYMFMGWSVLTCYFELARVLSHRALAPALLGGVLYSVGAVLHVLRWPVLHPVWFTAHDLFHLFALAGSAVHVWFMLQVVVPYQARKLPLPVSLSPRASPTLCLGGPLPAPVPAGITPLPAPQESRRKAADLPRRWPTP